MLDEEPSQASRIILPPTPSDVASDPVAAWSEQVNIDTYLPEMPENFPAFLETRVYQGSSGRVFPLPFHERISQTKRPHTWDAVHLENHWVRLMIMPQLGGRVHIAYDKISKYDMFYRNNVIKPALVGLTGPWISGGLEFNWPQHHRPGTFLPTDVSIEREDDGSVTVWCSDHDPFARMKGMHGIRLRPDSSRIEARVRLYNRSETRQSFLWWANVAAAVNDDYQSFFPRDVNYVADHAKRAVVSFPRARSSYYGVDYRKRVTQEKPDADRLDWYRNIPVPTSYMVMSTHDEFLGGYDHGRDAGFVHWASRDISPGKKQWTWGNASFGWAWDRNLTDEDGPYVELMAGVYTDNQPDFAFLAPGETKTFSQFWYPIRQIGPAHKVTPEVAARLDVGDSGIRIGIVASQIITDAMIRLSTHTGDIVFAETIDLRPESPFVRSLVQPVAQGASELVLEVLTAKNVLLRLQPKADNEMADEPAHAVEPPSPVDVATIDELAYIATYLDQYRHATRSPDPYWREILARDADESRATMALGIRAYDRADYEGAVGLLQRSIARRTQWTPTPASGGAHYRLGLALIRLHRDREARTVLARAAWDNEYAVPARYLLAREYVKAGHIGRAVSLLREVLDADPRHLQAADLLALLLISCGQRADADMLIASTLQRDPLDQWALRLRGQAQTADATIMLDVALEYAAVGFVAEALSALDDAERLLPQRPQGQVNVGPLIAYHRAAILKRAGRTEEAKVAAHLAGRMSPIDTLPSRLDDVDALRTVLELCPDDAFAAAQLGHWYYDRRRYADAIEIWRHALGSQPTVEISTIVHRNLGIASYNILRDATAANEHYDQAIQGDALNAKLRFELDQLSARSGKTSDERLAVLEGSPAVVSQRDDLTVSFAQLLVDVGRARDARKILACHQFQPWEGGEGLVLAAWDRATLSLARDSIASSDPMNAVHLVESALQPPKNLGEGRHPLANVSELLLALADAWAQAGDDIRAKSYWQLAAESTSDFTRMSTTLFGTKTYYAIVALYHLDKIEEARRITKELAIWVEDVAASVARINFFATSLPTMLLFIDDPAIERDREVEVIRAQLAGLAKMERKVSTES